MGKLLSNPRTSFCVAKILLNTGTHHVVLATLSPRGEGIKEPAVIVERKTPCEKTLKSL